MSQPPASLPAPGQRQSLGARLEAFGGVGPGFDLLRVVLASGVVVWHCFPLTTGNARLIDATPFWFAVNVFVPMFFVVSGFLVTASANRISVGPYLLNRIARIFPALIAVSLVAGLLFGPVATSLPLTDYLRDPLLFRYLLNGVGLLSYELPGVFTDNPIAAVNGSLWTVRFELACYAGLAVLMMLGLARTSWPYVLAYLILVGIALFLSATAASDEGFIPFNAGFLAQATKVLPYFLLGGLLWLLRDRIPLDGRLALLCALFLPTLGLFGDPAWLKQPLFWLGVGPPLAYLTIWLGLTRLPKLHILGGGDFSYGIYLFHFPILQMLIWGFGISQWWVLALVAAPIVLLTAAASWHLVERPALLWRKNWSIAGRQAAQAALSRAEQGPPPAS
jgi:peptidoglycan/LPS O-acetylase OafA/YrhL